MLTPGVSFVKSRKFRPLLGRPWIEAELMRVDDSARGRPGERPTRWVS